MRLTRKAALTLALALPLGLASALPAAAQGMMSSAPVIDAGHTLLTVSAQGSSTRTPDMASFWAGVTTQGATASEALRANSAAMDKVMASLRRAGVAERDIQTSNLSLNPVYAQPRRLPDGSYENDQPQKIVGYQASNNVTVRQRKISEMGKVIDALVSSGANQVNGPSFMLSEPEAAENEARTDAMRRARARADLYAKAAGLKVLRVVSISESGGYSPPQPVMFRMRTMDVAAPPPPPPVAPGELETAIGVTVQYELGN